MIEGGRSVPIEEGEIAAAGAEVRFDRCCLLYFLAARTIAFEQKVETHL
jgi:hypothetical protein